MGLFDKKYCDICGEKIGLLGNKKLEDGNMCKTCAKKLSPWFEDRRHSTLEEIKGQLAYREQNKAAVARFRETLRLGDDMKVLVDEEAGTFMVTRARDLQEANPDVIDLSAVKSCTMDVDRTRRELYRELEDGKKESYNPRRYEYTFYFRMCITLEHPYIDEIRFNLNSMGLDIEYQDRSFLGTGTFDPSRDSEYRAYTTMGNDIIRALTTRREPQAQAELPQEAPAAPAAREVTCPWCGSRIQAAPDGTCPCCGGSLDS